MAKCKATKTKEAPPPALLIEQRIPAANTALAFEYTPGRFDCQDFKISVDTLTRAAFLIGDLGCFLLAKCPKLKKPFDPEFNRLYFKAVEYLKLEDEVLRKAAVIELAREQGYERI